MYIVINGGGKVGSYLGHTLTGKGHHVAVIEKRPEILERMAAELPTSILMIEGDGSSAKFQEDAGVGRADVFVAVTGEDEIISCPASSQRPGSVSSVLWLASIAPE